jgi:hypothetical protein
MKSNIKRGGHTQVTNQLKKGKTSIPLGGHDFCVEDGKGVRKGWKRLGG